MKTLISRSAFFPVVIGISLAAALPTLAQPSLIGELVRPGAPFGLSTFTDGRIFSGGLALNTKVMIFSPDGQVLLNFGTFGTDPGQFVMPSSGAPTPDQTQIFVCDAQLGRIQIFDLAGGFLGTFGSNGSGFDQFSEATDMVFMPDGRFLVADSGNGRVMLYNAPGVPALAIGAGFLDNPLFVGLTPDGNIAVADRQLNNIFVYGTDGSLLGSLDTSGDGALPSLRGVACSHDGRFFVTDELLGLIKVYSAAGQFLGSFGDGLLDAPNGIAVLPNGRIYVASSNDDRIVIFSDPQAVALPETTVRGKKVQRVSPKKKRLKIRGEADAGFGTAVNRVLVRGAKAKVRLRPNNSWNAVVRIGNRNRARLRVLVFDDLDQRSAKPTIKRIRRK